ncbi:MAG: peptide ABC transporter substrate-binding protein [bacterium]|nr:peptide ABC transporter substrate-binding protein [bacterium]
MKRRLIPSLFTILICILALSPLSLAEPIQQALTVHGRDEPETLDPDLASGVVENNILINLFEGLMKYHPETNAAEYGAAENHTVSPDGTTYTFKIRQNAQWSDGIPVTAQNFWDGWERLLNPKTASKYAWYLYIVKNAEEYNTGKSTDPKQLGFKAVDSKTFQITLKNPAPYFVSMLTHYATFPIRKDVVEKYGNQWTLPGQMVANGPFTLKSWIPNKEILMEKNPKYWDAANVRLDQVRFLPVPDFETALKMYNADQLDTVFELPPIKVRTLKQRKDFVGKPYLNNEYYYLNFKRPPLNDLRVRKALSLAIDRNVITDKILQRGDVPITSFTPPGLPGYTSPKGLGFDPQKAKALFKEAGYGPGGKPFPTLEILYNTKDDTKTVSEVVQSLWKNHLGITVTLRNEEWKSFLKSRHSGNFDIGRAGWIGDYVDPTTFLEIFQTNSGLNDGKYNNPKYDTLLAQAQKEQDPVQRMVLLQKVEELLLNDVAIIPIYSQAKNFLVKPYVKGYYPTIKDCHPLNRVYLEK